MYEGPIETAQHCKVYPNPSTTSAILSYELKQTSKVHLSIYNQLGQLVYQYSAEQPAGTQKLIWEAYSQPEGLYYYKLIAEGQIAVGKILKVR
jgi:hypothetical protein